LTDVRAPLGEAPTPADRQAVRELLGREPNGEFVVVVRRHSGQPVVIANDPLLRDGTPMPTRYWLLDPEIRAQVSRLEAEGGVKEAESAIPPERIADMHARYAAERDRLLPADWSGPKPSGGVGGTRFGVKCVHAHVAWWLAGGDDPVGAWAAERLALTRELP
jgi:uncharacterized protein